MRDSVVATTSSSAKGSSRARMSPASMRLMSSRFVTSWLSRSASRSMTSARSRRAGGSMSSVGFPQDARRCADRRQGVRRSWDTDRGGPTSPLRSSADLRARRLPRESVTFDRLADLVGGGGKHSSVASARRSLRTRAQHQSDPCSTPPATIGGTRKASSAAAGPGSGREPWIVDSDPLHAFLLPCAASGCGVAPIPRGDPGHCRSPAGRAPPRSRGPPTPDPPRSPREGSGRPRAVPRWPSGSWPALGRSRTARAPGAHAGAPPRPGTAASPRAGRPPRRARGAGGGSATPRGWPPRGGRSAG